MIAEIYIFQVTSTSAGQNKARVFIYTYLTPSRHWCAVKQQIMFHYKNMQKILELIRKAASWTPRDFQFVLQLF